MPRTAVIPTLITLSGPGNELPAIEEKLAEAGLVPVDIEGFEDDPHHSHGLPSYADPITAAAASYPNAGHTPGTLHPSELAASGGVIIPNPVPNHGEPYEADPAIGFFTVTGDPSTAERVVQGTPWTVRMHSAPASHTLRPPAAELLVEAERVVEFLRSQEVTTG